MSNALCSGAGVSFNSLDQNSEPMAFLELASVGFQLDIGQGCGRDLSSGVTLGVLELVDQVGLVVGMIREGEAERSVGTQHFYHQGQTTRRKIALITNSSCGTFVTLY